MGAQAVALSKAVDYRSAGTVEFIVDTDRNFYFLEMNTRLQVEHPVTEYVTGLDLVEQMIRVAAGEKLSFGQKDVKLDGWAVEARVYAEDPFRNFMPSIGRLTRYRPPEETGTCASIPASTRAARSACITIPMIAKLIAGGRTRDEAIGRMRGALDAYYIRGVSHNIPFLAALMAHPRFAEGRLPPVSSTRNIRKASGRRTRCMTIPGCWWRSRRPCTGSSKSAPPRYRARCTATSAMSAIPGWR